MLDNKPIGLDTAFKHNDIQYPANWLRLALPEERAAIGITEVADPETFDDRYYWSVGNPRDLDQCKAMMISQVKQNAAAFLAPTDWKIIRFIESATPIGSSVTAYREAIRADSNNHEAAINACTSVDELAALQLTWTQGE
jgi:hypothetical protein